VSLSILQVTYYEGRFPYQAWRATLQWLFARQHVNPARLMARGRTALFAAAQWERCTKEHVKLLTWIVGKFRVAWVSINQQVRSIEISAWCQHGLVDARQIYCSPLPRAESILAFTCCSGAGR
jgi:hypothetical protein